MNTSIREIIAEHKSYAWSCLKCGLPNFSTTLFVDFSISDYSSNSYGVLDSSVPPKTSIPKKEKMAQRTLPELKVLNINFQSIINKTQEFRCLIDIEKLDVVIGTESWLSPEISSGEMFPPGYTEFRADRKSRTRSGRVFFILVSDN